MVTKLTKYRKPISGINEPRSLAGYWDIAYDNFENKKYKESLFGVFNYINPSLLNDVDTDRETIKISQQHGSATINITIKDNTFKVIVPFLKINKANIVPLMRKVAEVNFHPLMLTQIILQKKALWFHFATTLDLCQPNKIYDILREICLYADNFDDEFIEKYKATFFNKPKVTPLTLDEQDTVWAHFTEISDEYKKYMGYFEKKRWPGSEWDIIVLTLLNIANMPCVNGTLRSDLDEYIYNMFNGETDFAYRLDKGKKYLNGLLGDLDRDKIFKDLYHAEKFISLKYRSSVNILQKEFEAHKQRIYAEINSDSYFDAAFSLQVLFAKILYDYNLEENHERIICNTMAKAGGKETDEATAIMKQTFDNFLQGTIETEGSEKKGFFSKLFG